MPGRCCWLRWLHRAISGALRAYCPEVRQRRIGGELLVRLRPGRDEGDPPRGVVVDAPAVALRQWRGAQAGAALREERLARGGQVRFSDVVPRRVGVEDDIVGRVA